MTNKLEPDFRMKMSTAAGTFYRLLDGTLVDEHLVPILPTTHPEVWDSMMPNARPYRAGTNAQVDHMLDQLNGRLES